MVAGVYSSTLNSYMKSLSQRKECRQRASSMGNCVCLYLATWVWSLGLHGRRELNPTSCSVTSIAQTHRHSTHMNIHNKSINDLIIKIYGPDFSFLLFFLSCFLHFLPFFPCPCLFSHSSLLLHSYLSILVVSLFLFFYLSPPPLFSPSSCPDCLLTSATLCLSLPSVLITVKSQCLVWLQFSKKNLHSWFYW